MVVAAYYGWPIVEAIILILPLPDPKESLEYFYSIIGSVTGIFTGILGGSSSTGASAPGYSSNLEAQPDAFMGDEEDDSDDDIGSKPSDFAGRAGTLDYSSDEKVDIDVDEDDDDDETEASGAAGSTELIDLNADEERSYGGASNVPKLSGPN